MLGQMLLDFRLAHWEHLAAGFAAPHSSSGYLSMLDFMRAINESTMKRCGTLVELGTNSSAGGRHLNKLKRKAHELLILDLPRWLVRQ